MRRIIIILFLAFAAVHVKAQQTNSNQLLTRQDYLTKNKKQKTTAFILLGGGFTSLATGFFTLGGKSADNTVNFLLMATGFSAMVASVPVFISAGKNKKKAMKLSAGNQFIPYLNNNSLALHSISSVNIKINIQ